MSAKFTEADLERAERFEEAATQCDGVSEYIPCESIAQLIADVREQCAAKCDEVARRGGHIDGWEGCAQKCAELIRSGT